MASSYKQATANIQRTISKEPKTTWTFKPRDLCIIWGSDPRYWRLPDLGSDEPAELQQVCWLELTGITPENLQAGKYEIRFRVGMREWAFGFEETSPVYVMAKVGKKGKYMSKKVKLLPGNEDFAIPEATDKLMIEITQESSSGGDSKIYFGLYGVWGGKWKGGLLVHEATVQKVY